MAGTRAGGLLAAQKNREKHGEDYYAKIGAVGGKNGTTGGFHANRELARAAGRLGGYKSRRAPGTSKTAIYRRKRLEREQHD